MNPDILERIPRHRLPGLLQRMPKAELHIHIEGSLEPELIFELARRNGVKLTHTSVPALRQAYAFTDLQSFLDLYYAGASVLLRQEDFFDMAMAYFRQAAADGVVHAEVFFDPQTHTARGVPLGTVIQGLTRARQEAARTLGLSSALILCFLRHLSQEDAFATLESALPWREHFIGVGLDSSERGHPPGKFAQVFERCRALGLHVVAHAGEEGPPAYIRSALDDLQVQRIDHGVRCLEDPALVAELARSQMPLTVCPLSNVKLCVYPSMQAHRLPELLKAGLCVTVNSDDPAYFGGYVGENFRALFAAHPDLGPRQAWQLARHSLDASFVDETVKAGWRARLDEVFAEAVAASAAATTAGGCLVWLMDTITQVTAQDAGAVAVSGSHGGTSSGRFALAAPLKLAVFNDAGVGKDEAGIAALAMLQAQGRAAATVAHTSARIGDALETWNHGVISHVNAAAQALGLAPGQALRDAVQGLR